MIDAENYISKDFEAISQAARACRVCKFDERFGTRALCYDHQKQWDETNHRFAQAAREFREMALCAAARGKAERSCDEAWERNGERR